MVCKKTQQGGCLGCERVQMFAGFLVPPRSHAGKANVDALRSGKIKGTFTFDQMQVVVACLAS